MTKRVLRVAGVLLLVWLGLPPLPTRGDHVYYESPACYDCGGQCCAAENCPRRLWVRGDALLWWMDGFSVPPLVTTSPVGTDRASAGVLGEPLTRILSGNRLGDEARFGGRVNAGYWLDPCMTTGIMVTYLDLGRDSSASRFGSNQFPILARPFFNLEPGFQGPDAELVSFPNLLEGNITVHGETTFRSLEVLFRRAAGWQPGCRIDLLAGWRFSQLEDDLIITDMKTALSGESGLVVGTTLNELDRFRTRNRFHGAEVGVVSEMRGCNWSLELLMKLALGNTQSTTNISGSTIVTVPLPAAPPDVHVTPSGLLAQQTNIGTFVHNEFAMIPELGVTAGYDLTCQLRATVGYTFLYWSRVARPGDQIDLNLNLSQLEAEGLIGPPRPEFKHVLTDMWAQGLSLGLEYRF